MIVTAAIRVAAAGLGAAVAGPLGGALGGRVGEALVVLASTLIGKSAEQFGAKSAEKLLDSGADSLVERFRRPVYIRLALRKLERARDRRHSAEVAQHQIASPNNVSTNCSCASGSPMPTHLARPFRIMWTASIH